MAKWPNVPSAYGWLGLDARGNWYLRDEQAQAAGAFASGRPGAKGALVQLEKLVDFIQRNYEVDEAGRWFFQNGPQRVYVELEVAPWIWRLQPDGGLCSHTEQLASYRSSWVDEQGRLYVDTELGLGLVHSQDMHLAADWVEQGRWLPQECLAAELPQRFGFVLSPQASLPA